MPTEYPSHWTDMSNYLVHFAKGKDSPAAQKASKGAKKRSEDDPGYETMMSVLSSGQLKPGAAFGIGRKLAPQPETQQAVCLSEVPPGDWRRLSERRQSAYGIGFSRKFISVRGGGPIWYARNGGTANKALKKLMRMGADDPAHPVWQITAMIDAPGVYWRASYEYEWEREWRHIGELNFEPEDVAFLFIPEELHAQAKAFFAHAYHENLGPAYVCPFIDAKWSRDRVEEELSKEPAAFPPAPPLYDHESEMQDLGDCRRMSMSVTRLRRVSES